MIRMMAVLAGLSVPAAASQVFTMDLPEVLPMADCIVLAEVVTMGISPSGECIAANYSLAPVEVLSGIVQPDTCFGASYLMDLPRSRTLDDGTEVWESPLVSGSGLEMSCAPGDTVIALMSVLDQGDSLRFSVIRMEPPCSLREILELLAVHD